MIVFTLKSTNNNLLLTFMFIFVNIHIKCHMWYPFTQLDCSVLSWEWHIYTVYIILHSLGITIDLIKCSSTCCRAYKLSVETLNFSNLKRQVSSQSFPGSEYAQGEGSLSERTLNGVVVGRREGQQYGIWLCKFPLPFRLPPSPQSA